MMVEEMVQKTVQKKNSTAQTRLWAGRLARPVAAFARARSGGAMLIGGSLAMLTMATFGAMMSNYGWREAQEEEITAALRAAVSASAHLMRGGPKAAEDKIKQRISDFMRGLLGNLTISKDDIVVDEDAATGRTTITIAGNAKFGFRNLWGIGGAGGSESLSGEQVVVEFSESEFEFALALDVSTSMGHKPSGWTDDKMTVLKDSIKTIAQTVDDLSKTNPGIITVSLVPYTSVVNVADTSGNDKTDAKERYVRMLTGAGYSTQTSRDTEDHWVDTFHYYGSGADMGILASRSLPDFLALTDWDLNQTDSADVSAQAPHLGTWDTQGKDFWNGCVMARWGAYWDPDARPTPWDASDSDNWPATTDVDGWEPGGPGIAALPLHLSDAPPDEGHPNTRFTAYSWPDARIHGFGDSWLNNVMRHTLNPAWSGFGSRLQTISDNFWSLRNVDRGGSLHCPDAYIVPLTDDFAALEVVDEFEHMHTASYTQWGQTFLHLGVVWALRTLSPLWQDIWNTTSASGDDLPRTPCLPTGTKQGCSQLVEKAIVIVSDGQNSFGPPPRGRSFTWGAVGSPIARNPNWFQSQCRYEFNNNTSFRTAASADDPATFESSFDVDAQGLFTASGLSAVLDGFQGLHEDTRNLDPTTYPSDQLTVDLYRARWEAALKDVTPWQLFRGHDPDSPTKNTDVIDVLVNSTYDFGIPGRPVQNGHYCRPYSPFSAYGRVDDLVNVGDGPPVEDVAPFSVSSWSPSSPTSDLERPVISKLDDWFLKACDLAGQRRVRIHALYIGGSSDSWEQDAIATLEDCVDRGYGGNSQVDEVHVTPTPQALKRTLEDIIDIKRKLRFVDP